MNKLEFYKYFLENYSKRSFDPKETLRWLTHNKSITMSWGFQKPQALPKDEDITGLIFIVNGNHHKGFVLITLAWNDTYTLRFLDTDYKEIKDTEEMVYCDELQVRVDSVIEHIEDYTF